MPYIISIGWLETNNMPAPHGIRNKHKRMLKLTYHNTYLHCKLDIVTDTVQFFASWTADSIKEAYTSKRISYKVVVLRCACVYIQRCTAECIKLRCLFSDEPIFKNLRKQNHFIKKVQNKNVKYRIYVNCRCWTSFDRFISTKYGNQHSSFFSF